MALPFFARGSAAKASPPPPFSPPTTANNRANNNRPNVNKGSLFQTTPPAPPSLTSARIGKSRNTDPAFEPKPYASSLETIYTPHPNVTIEPVKTAHIPSLMRITGLLLPVRYPNSFYTATITDSIVASISRVAIYHDHPVTDITATTFPTTAKAPSLSSSDKVIGGIRCRLEPLPPPSELSVSCPLRQATNLYIQTLHLLSPYRGRGIAASLLDSLIYDSASPPGTPMRAVSGIVRHYNIQTVTAHVHETNEEALLWYLARGFTIQGGVVEGYYRRLKPGGAKIVSLKLAWEEDDEDTKPGSLNDAGCKDDEGDEDWEKVELDECDPTTAEKLEEYGTVNGKEYVKKRVKSA
ncbi:GNAT family acetyltransferase [Histoplasma ohiense]|nr:GNAT family acetyltransferase [Histoplasma ohiense (nom. inval.)]